MRVIAPTMFAALLYLTAPLVMADAPVLDDSENFALLEEQAQAAEELPVARENAIALNDDMDEPTPVGHARQHDTTSNNADFVNKIQSLQNEIQELRGQLEVQAHDLDELKQQLSLSQNIQSSSNQPNLPLKHTTSHAEIETIKPLTPQPSAETSENEDMTLSKTNAEQPPVPSIAHTTNNVRINPADEQISYLAAYDLVKQKNAPQATQAMQVFLSKYPHGGYSANAHYWLGELYLKNKDFPSAISQFDTVIQNFKSSSKYASSRLKLGYALAESGQIREAKEQLRAVMNRYPDTATAHLAHLKLEKLGE